MPQDTFWVDVQGMYCLKNNFPHAEKYGFMLFTIVPRFRKDE
jgi:hypothetical protein